MKAEVLAARANGLWDVLRLRGRHHEDNVLGRLLERLQQGVEGSVGDLVRLIKDDDLEAIPRGTVARGIAQFTDLVDAAVCGGVDLKHVDGVALPDLQAGSALQTGLSGGTDLGADRPLAVQRGGENAGDGGLADAAVARKDIPMRDAVLREGVQQRAGDVVLPDNVGEA